MISTQKGLRPHKHHHHIGKRSYAHITALNNMSTSLTSYDLNVIRLGLRDPNLDHFHSQCKLNDYENN